ncbi:unnamed protein product [Caenorhabditis nigoni]
MDKALLLTGVANVASTMYSTYAVLSELHVPSDIRMALNNSLGQVKQLLENSEVASHAHILALAYDKKNLKSMGKEMESLKAFMTDFGKLRDNVQTLTIENKLMDSLCAQTSQLKLNG